MLLAVQHPVREAVSIWQPHGACSRSREKGRPDRHDAPVICRVHGVAEGAIQGQTTVRCEAAHGLVTQKNARIPQRTETQLLPGKQKDGGFRLLRF